MKPGTLVRRFKKLRALVVGDICRDRWCHYDPRESDPSRETKIPRLGITRTEVTSGAGGTVANNLSALGTGHVAVLGAIGRDGFGFELERALAARNIDYSLLVASDELQTYTYSKLVNTKTGKEDKPRVDFINNRPLPSDVEDQLIANFHSVFQDFDVIVVSDQSETEHGGVMSDAFREVVTDVAERFPDKVVVADSRTRIERFRHTLAKANQREAIAACKKLFGKVDYQRLRRTIGFAPFVVTRGGKGTMLFDDDGRKTVSAVTPEKFVDDCGAGDSFAAGLALAFKASGNIEQAALFGSLVSSVTIAKPGTGVATAREVVALARTLENGASRSES